MGTATRAGTSFVSCNIYIFSVTLHLFIYTIKYIYHSISFYSYYYSNMVNKVLKGIKGFANSTPRKGHLSRKKNDWKSKKPPMIMMMMMMMMMPGQLELI